jgi:hypothetical protein
MFHLSHGLAHNRFPESLAARPEAEVLSRPPTKEDAFTPEQMSDFPIMPYPFLVSVRL